ncbi:MAG: hypothetical protein LBK97_00865 [Prevotellaceae bacterium]|jgi:putative ABC transport system permease protein|nr:hypothetical protein [Prevotellaceae bacterium]
MKLIIKNFLILLKRFTSSSLLNITGLAVAFAVFYVIIVQTYYDFGYNRNFKKNIYLYTTCSLSSTNRNLQTSPQSLNEFAGKYPEIINHCNIQMMWDDYDVRDSADEVIRTVTNIPITLSSENEDSRNFFNVFEPEIIAGDPSTVFTPGRAMLSESIAKKLFGNTNPTGKVFFKKKSNDPITVVAVCRDFPENCSMENGIYLLRYINSAEDIGSTGYVELVPGSREKILKKNAELRRNDGSDSWQTELTALTDIHLKFPEKGKGNINLTISLLTIGILLIIIAYINFVNFSVAMAPVRLKSFNIRRVLGESFSLLRFSIILDAVFLSFIAFLISILFISYIAGSVIKEFLSADLSLTGNIGLLSLIGASSLLMGFVAGIYPAFYSTSFKPAIALNGSFSTSRSSKNLRNILIALQYVTVIFLFITAGFIKLQQNFMQNKSLGLRTENVVCLRYGHNIKNELLKNPDIVDIARANTIQGMAIPFARNWEGTYNGMQASVRLITVSPNYLRFFGIHIIEGNDFSEEDDYGNIKMIVNRTFAEQYGFNHNITGTSFPLDSDKTADIIGIAEDTHFESLLEPIKPMAFITDENFSGGLIDATLIKLSGQNTAKTIDYIREEWRKYESYDIEVPFIGAMIKEYNYNQYYKPVDNLSKLISISGLITVIVTIMGVYGLILFNAKLKRKTIALHKINGASAGEVILMLNRGFIIQFVAAYAIAAPLAYIVVKRWLENFAYKTPVYLWVFIAGGLLVFVITALTVSYQSYKAATANPIEGIKES